MKWLLFTFVAFAVSANATWADDTINHYEETSAQLEGSLDEVNSYYNPIMQGLRFRYELSSRGNRVKIFRQRILPNFKNELFEICKRLDERHGAIAADVSNNPETRILGPTVEQKDEIDSIHKARALCATKGAYPESKRYKKYWLSYSNLDSISFDEYQSIIVRLSECLNRQSCRTGATKN